MAKLPIASAISKVKREKKRAVEELSTTPIIMTASTTYPIVGTASTMMSAFVMRTVVICVKGTYTGMIVKVVEGPQSGTYKIIIK